MKPPPSAATAVFDADLVRKYDGFGPRYTSYPTADRFSGAFAAQDLVDAWLARADEAAPLSVYVHLPFCDTLCYYCACNKVLTRDRTRSAKYLRYLAREIGMVAGIVSRDAPVAQLHWGGGTPTFLADAELASLMHILRDHFRFVPDAECSIEIDPRKVGPETVANLAALGFNRMSLGVQDFDPDVQRAVNRVQSEAETRAVMAAARANGFRSINVDLIYGLPRQDARRFAVTLDKVLAAGPDRIALYSYAHVPHLFKPQRRIGEETLPSAAEKLAILALAVGTLTAAGYVYIGMDHFARPEDDLARALRTGGLHRNFQGYSTRADCDLLAFGISAIGKTATTYSQNLRTLDEYYARLDGGALPCFRGYRLSPDDVVRRAAIQALMCNGAIDVANFEGEHAILVDDYFAAELAALAPLADDGLVTVSPDRIAVTPRGRFVLRAIAMVFDRHLREQRERARYSRVI